MASSGIESVAGAIEEVTMADDLAARPALSGGRLLVDALREGGVDTVFALAGGHIMGLLDACVPAGIRVIDVRHEGAASYAAEGWALATGRPGVAVVTAGPGFTNSLSGLFDAGVWNVPVVLIGGRTGLRMAGQGAVGDIDQRAIASSGVKWAATCFETARIPRYTGEALYRARAGRPGAVYLEVPQDIMAGKVAPSGEDEGFPAEPPRSTAPRQDVDRAIELLRQAERPLVIAGGGAFWSGAKEALERFCEVTGIPVTTTSSARGLVADSHPRCLGSLVHGGIALVVADLVLVVGSAFNANLGYGRRPLFGAQQRIVQLDISADGLGGNRRPDLGLVGDAATVLTDLAENWKDVPGGRERRDAWLEEARQYVATARRGWDQQIDEYEGSGIHAGAVAREVARFAREVAGDAVTLVADGGDALAWALGYFPAERPGRLLFTTTQLGALGVGLPFALAARSARPEEAVFAFLGDGSFGLSAMEVDTAVRHGLPMVVVVSNNAGWGDVRHEFEDKGYEGPRVAAELGFTRYDLLGAGLGAHAEHVTRLDELTPALRRAHASGRVAVVNVETDPTVECALLRLVSEMSLM
jgi:acetolactate synthase-1/2/3 large subunit